MLYPTVLEQKHPQGVHYSMWRYLLENPSPPNHNEGVLPEIPTLVDVVLVGVPTSMKIVKSHWSRHNITMGPQILCASVLRVAKIPSSFAPLAICKNLLTSMVGLIHSIWVHRCDWVSRFVCVNPHPPSTVMPSHLFSVHLVQLTCNSRVYQPRSAASPRLIVWFPSKKIDIVRMSNYMVMATKQNWQTQTRTEYFPTVGVYLSLFCLEICLMFV